jgi:hypothetical protein
VTLLFRTAVIIDSTALPRQIPNDLCCLYAYTYGIIFLVLYTKHDGLWSVVVVHLNLVSAMRDRGFETWLLHKI